MIIYKVYYRRGSQWFERSRRTEALGAHLGPLRHPGARPAMIALLDKYLSPPSEVDTPAE